MLYFNPMKHYILCINAQAKIQRFLKLCRSLSAMSSYNSYTAVLWAPQQLMPNSWFLHTQPIRRIVIPTMATKHMAMAAMMPAVRPTDPVTPTGVSPQVISARRLLSQLGLRSYLQSNKLSSTPLQRTLPIKNGIPSSSFRLVLMVASSEYPNCLQTTWASLTSKLSPQTSPQRPSTLTSNLPSPVFSPFVRRTSSALANTQIDNRHKHSAFIF